MRRSKSGQTLVEYLLILAFIVVVAFVILQALGSAVVAKNTSLATPPPEHHAMDKAAQ